LTYINGGIGDRDRQFLSWISGGLIGGVVIMAHKSDTRSSEAANFGALPIFQLGKDQTEAMLNVQKEMMTAYEEVSRSWIERVKAEVELWSDLAKKLSATDSVPDGMQAYRDTVAKRMTMATEDGQRLLEEGQKIIGAVNRSMSTNWPTGST
jgi:hypothetical protein